MAKTYRNPNPAVCGFANLHPAWRKACKDKNGRAAMAAFACHRE